MSDTKSMQVTDILQPILFPSDLIHQHPCMVNFHSWLRFTECEQYTIFIHVLLIIIMCIDLHVWDTCPNVVIYRCHQDISM